MRRKCAKLTQLIERPRHLALSPRKRRTWQRRSGCNPWQRFLRSANELAYPSKIEARRRFSSSQNTFASRDNRRPRHRLVPEMSAQLMSSYLRISSYDFSWNCDSRIDRHAGSRLQQPGL